MWVERSGPNRCVGGYIVDDKMVTVVGNVADGCTSQSSVWEGQRPSDGESCCTILKNTIIPAILCQDLAELGMDKELHRGQCPPWFISFYRDGSHTKISILAIIWVNKWLWALLRVHHPLSLYRWRYFWAYSHLKKRVGTWASLEDGQAHVPTLLSEEWARGREAIHLHASCWSKFNDSQRPLA